MMTELLSHDPSWGFRRGWFSSQSKHVPSEVVHSKVLLFITHQQHTASELLRGVQRFMGVRLTSQLQSMTTFEMTEQKSSQ